MDLTLKRDLRVGCEQAFAALTEPDLMNQWSTARIKLVETGDGGSAAGVGTLRRVTLPGPVRMVLREVVAESEGPHHFVYRVVDTPPIRTHEGTISVRPTGSGCRVEWRVNATFAHPWLGLLAERGLRHELSDSLRRLSDIAPSAKPRSLPPLRELEDPLEPLYRRAHAIAREQQDLADGLGDDPRYWFTRVYQYVTEAQIAACEDGVYAHPAWVLRLVDRFHAYYCRSLLPASGASAEEHWAQAFRRMDRARATLPTTFAVGTTSVLAGMRAHIEVDLPRAIAEVFIEHYQGRCDAVRFRADYLAMADIFRGAAERMLDFFDPREMPWIDRLASRAPMEIQDFALAKRLYDIPAGRRRAFRESLCLAALGADASA